MRKIIEKLKEQRDRAEKMFIENSLIKRNCPLGEPCPDTDMYLDDIYDLNQAISILENHNACKNIHENPELNERTKEIHPRTTNKDNRSSTIKAVQSDEVNRPGSRKDS